MSEERKKIGRFRVLKQLGEGGMAVVYLAQDEVLRRRVALKVLRLPAGIKPRKRWELEQRFRRESRIAGRLSHANIVTIFDVGEDDGQPYIAMEYLTGQSLREIIDLSAPMPIDKAVDIAKQILSALDYAHSRGVVHRDITPSNIILSPTGRVKVTDFGIARIASEITISDPGAMIGSPNYMAPEQVEGREVDHRADIFAVGAVLYEMLVGRKLFSGDNVAAICHQIVNVEPDLSGKFPPRVEMALRRALAKDPAQRFQTAEEFLEALRDPLLLTRHTGVGDRPADDVPQAGLGPAEPGVAARMAVAISMVVALLAVVFARWWLAPAAVVAAGVGLALGAGRYGRWALGFGLCSGIISWLWSFFVSANSA